MIKIICFCCLSLLFLSRPGGLMAALGELASRSSGLFKLHCRLARRPAVLVHDPSTATHLYRIAQEALHNVVKHADAHAVRVIIERVGSDVRFAVIDDGAGFDENAVPPGHLGLAGMRVRAEKIGARLAVASASGTGTTIEVIVPAAVLAG